MRHLTKLLVLLVLLVPPAFGQSFTMNEGFLRTMIQRNTIQPTFRVRMKAHGPLHTLANDCEMHVAESVLDASFRGTFRHRRGVSQLV